MSDLADKLEALRKCIANDDWDKIDYPHIKALKEAIAALRQQEPVAWMWPEYGPHKASYYDIDSLDAKSLQEQGVELTKLYAAPVQSGRIPAACHHEPYQGRCIHCDIPFKNGMPLPAAPVREDQRSKSARDEWKDAVIDELIIQHTYTAEHDNNPRKAVKDAIHWNVQVALDPQVSSDAQKLIDEGIEAAASILHEPWARAVRALKGKP